MKQRFAVTLLAVAIASLSASAFAMAPVIGDFRSPVISDDTPATNSNDFVYPDADDITDRAPDPDGTKANNAIIWSFFESSNTYQINGRDSLVLATDDPNNPAAAKAVNSTGDDTESADSNVRTITYRNKALSPWTTAGHPPTGTFPDTVANGGDTVAGVLPAQTKVITMYASDGSTYTKKSFTAYTANKSVDKLSGGLSPTVVTGTTVPAVGTTAWSSSILVGTPTFASTNGTNGLCVTVPLGLPAPDLGNFATWSSPFAIIQLTRNSVYRIRINVAGNPAIAATVTPLWDFAIDNVDPSGTPTDQKYGMDLINWDNLNSSSNAAGPAAGKHTFDIWWAPMALSATDWNDPATGEFSTGKDATNDAHFLYRVLDSPGNVDAQNDAGTLCLQNYQIVKVDSGSLQVLSAAAPAITAPVGELEDGTAVAGQNMIVTTLFGPNGNAGSGGTVLTNSAAGITLRPLTAGVPNGAPPATPSTLGSWYTEFITAYPGDKTFHLDTSHGTPATPAQLLDNYTVAWQPNQLLRITAGAQAPDAASQSNPPDLMRITMDAPTSELGLDLTFSGGGNLLGMPKQASVTTYTGFFYTQAVSGSVTPEYRRLRPSIGVLCVPGVTAGGTMVNNGGITFTFLKVDVIDTAGAN